MALTKWWENGTSWQWRELTSLCKVSPQTGWLGSQLLGSIMLDPKSYGRRWSSLLWLQRCGCGLLGNRGDRWWGGYSIRHTARTVHAGRLGLKSRRKYRVNACRHWLLWLELRLVASKACRLWCKALEASLLLLKLLNAKL